MRILGLDELPSGMEGQVQLLDLSAGWGPMDFRRVKEARKIGYPAADYFGVYAVERGEVVSMVRVLRLPFTTGTGVEQISGIQGVVTRRDRGRRGLARTLLEEVHRREKQAGSKFSLLWTGRGQVAHGLYESMGYADIYTPELATVRCDDAVRKAGSYELRRARRGDVGLMEELHATATERRLGFTPRPTGLIASLVGLGFLSLGSLWLILRDREPVGYALLQKSPAWSRLDEVVVTPGTSLEEVVSLFESRAAGSWLAVRNTGVRDLSRVLRAHRYHVTRFAYYSLLARALDGASPAVSGTTLGTQSRSFTCQQLDYF